MVEDLKFTCSLCSDIHEGLPDFGCDSPDYFNDVPEDERAARCQFNDDLCIVDHEHYFIRAVLLVPVKGTHHNFGWGVWTTLSERNFNRYCELWGSEDVSGEGPYFGWFSNRLPFYPDTSNLKTHVHLQNGGMRPLLELEPSDHSLAVDQREGISWKRAVEIAERLMHPDPGEPSNGN